MVFTALQENLRDGEINLVQKAAPQEEYAAQAIEHQISREELKLIRVKEAYENGIDSLDEYRSNKQKITDRIEQLKASKPKMTRPKTDSLVKQFRARHRHVLKQLRDPSVAPEEKNTLLRSFIDKIIFDKAAGRVEIFYYI